MTKKKDSAGLLIYRRQGGDLEVFLVHPGGPYWATKDLGAWSIPKGEFDPGEDPFLAAKREFEEETGFEATGQFLPLTPIRQPSGKVVHAWASEGDYDATATSSNTFSMEWPPRSGKLQEFPEIDRAAWLRLGDANERILKGHRRFLDELRQLLGEDSSTVNSGQTEKPRQGSLFE